MVAWPTNSLYLYLLGLDHMWQVAEIFAHLNIFKYDVAFMTCTFSVNTELKLPVYTHFHIFPFAYTYCMRIVP